MQKEGKSNAVTELEFVSNFILMSAVSLTSKVPVEANAIFEDAVLPSYTLEKSELTNRF